MIFSAATLTVVDGLEWLFIFPRWFPVRDPENGPKHGLADFLTGYSLYSYFRRVWLG